MTDIYAEGALPPPGTYIAPAVSVRATWSATDGSRPEEVYVDWKESPPAAEVLTVVRTLLNAGATIDRYTAPLAEPEPTGCPATAKLWRLGSEAHTHRCCLDPGHEPVEPDGRAHRCECGGLFMADNEVPDVAGSGRRERDNRR